MTRRAFLWLFLLWIIGPNVAHAEPITYRFTGHITSVFAEQTSLGVGDLFVGLFTYDPARLCYFTCSSLHPNGHPATGTFTVGEYDFYAYGIDGYAYGFFPDEERLGGFFSGDLLSPFFFGDRFWMFPDLASPWVPYEPVNFSGSGNFYLLFNPGMASVNGELDSVSVVPEPTSLFLLATGAVGLVLRRPRPNLTR